MKKYIIVIETEADLTVINAGMQPLLKAILDSGVAIDTYTIQVAKS